MANNESFQGVSTCYVFKSRLQEYAQKVGFSTPVYETIKEGPSHEPSFRSTVIVNNTRYDSLPGFSNRKAAEQSAAEVALMKLPDSGPKLTCLSQPVHETGLCKNLLQDYAQKMNYAIPQYVSQFSGTPGKNGSYSSAVKIGGIEYIGGEARTKKEAEIKAARTALLAIQSSGDQPNDKSDDYSAYTVIPLRKNVTDLGISNQECAAALKQKKAGFKKRKKKYGPDAYRAKYAGGFEMVKAEPENAAVVSTQGTESGPTPIAATRNDIVPWNNVLWNNFRYDEQKTAFMVNQNDYGALNFGFNSQWGAVTGAALVTSEVDSSAMCQRDLNGGTSCLELQTAFATDADQGRSINTEAEIS